MKKSAHILQHLADCELEQHVSDIAAAIGEADAVAQVSALLNHLATLGVNAGTERGRWEITQPGREWLQDIAVELAEEESHAPHRIVHEMPAPTPPGNPHGGPRRAAAGVRRAKIKPKASVLNEAIARTSAPLRRNGSNGSNNNSDANGAHIALPPIDRGIPLTDYRPRNAYTRLAERMAVGDSVLMDSVSNAGTLRTAMHRLGMRGVQRKQPNGECRVWRVK